MQFDNIRITTNEVLNRIFAGYIVNPIDVYTFVANYDPHMEIGDVAKIVEDLQKHGKL